MKTPNSWSRAQAVGGRRTRFSEPPAAGSATVYDSSRFFWAATATPPFPMVTAKLRRRHLCTGDTGILSEAEMEAEPSNLVASKGEIKIIINLWSVFLSFFYPFFLDRIDEARLAQNHPNFRACDWSSSVLHDAELEKGCLRASHGVHKVGGGHRVHHVQKSRPDHVRAPRPSRAEGINSVS